MAKKKVKITSPVDLSEHVVEVDASTPLPPGAESVTDQALEREWDALPPGKIVPCRREPRKLPEGMNKFNSTNEWLMLILESLYRIEAKLGA
ncbi:MAG: hypothetical protein VZQ81_09700 [Succiniclasticum sp.]|nr:hypothetical protein [Succiniclasticum sp.]